jgi:hypothetical protein
VDILQVDGEAMVKIIEAVFPASLEPAFDTAEEAISFGQEISAERCNADIASCFGNTIRSTYWSDDILELYLGNNKVLRFTCAQYVVNVAAEVYRLENMAGKIATQGNVVIHLARKEILWKRSEMIESLVGHTLRRIHASQTGLFVYVTNFGILALNVLINRVSGVPFLFWEPSD